MNTVLRVVIFVAFSIIAVTCVAQKQEIDRLRGTDGQAKFNELAEAYRALRVSCAGVAE